MISAEKQRRVEKNAYNSNIIIAWSSNEEEEENLLLRLSRPYRADQKGNVEKENCKSMKSELRHLYT